jgi:hypothetical protein
MGGNEIFPAGARMADADSHSAEFGSKRSVDRAKPVVAGEAASNADFDLERCEIELVMEDRERPVVQFVKTKSLLNGIAAVVHESLRLYEQDPVAAEAAFRDQAPELLLPGTKAVRLGNRVESHEADIVSVKRILCARIAEADPELHARSLA